MCYYYCYCYHVSPLLFGCSFVFLGGDDDDDGEGDEGDAIDVAAVAEAVVEAVAVVAADVAVGIDRGVSSFSSVELLGFDAWCWCWCGPS